MFRMVKMQQQKIEWGIEILTSEYEFYSVFFYFDFDFDFEFNFSLFLNDRAEMHIKFTLWPYFVSSILLSVFFLFSIFFFA